MLLLDSTDFDLSQECSFLGVSEVLEVRLYCFESAESRNEFKTLDRKKDSQLVFILIVSICTSFDISVKIFTFQDG